VLATAQGANRLALMWNAANATAAPQRPVAASDYASGAAVGIDPPAVPAPTSTTGDLGDRRRPQRTRIETIPPPTPIAPDGVWLEFEGARWYAGGAAVPFTPERFEAIGDYHGFPVYREKREHRDEIWVSVVKDGPVAPYSKR
jgi:hypothetical protein